VHGRGRFAVQKLRGSAYMQRDMPLGSSHKGLVGPDSPLLHDVSDGDYSRLPLVAGRSRQQHPAAPSTLQLLHLLSVQGCTSAAHSLSTASLAAALPAVELQPLLCCCDASGRRGISVCTCAGQGASYSASTAAAAAWLACTVSSSTG
jgi:hypothetical protein